MRNKNNGVLVIFLALLLSCASSSKMSPMQFRQISTRMFEGSYEHTFRASMTVLQDHSYIIKQTDMDAGLITGEVNRESSGSSQFFQALFGDGQIANKGTLIEASVVLSKLNENNTEVRITIQEKVYSSSGGTTKVKQLQDGEVYKSLFDDILVEIKRREAIGR